MEPKFQSTFIPKGPLSAATPASSFARPATSSVSAKDIFSFIAHLIFGLSLLMAIGVFGYKYFLNRQIEQMNSAIESGRAALSIGTISELTRLSDRIASTKEIVEQHRIISPVFNFLMESTPRSVRFGGLDYASSKEEGMVVALQGEAKSYAALANLEQAFEKNQSFKAVSFSDLALNDKGEVIFLLNITVDPNFLSYDKSIEENLAEPLPSASTDTSASASTTVPQTTSTNPLSR